MYPPVLGWDGFVGVDRIRTFSVGSEATMVAMHISAVHHKSAMR
jgi:hypothetical protein